MARFPPMLHHLSLHHLIILPHLPQVNTEPVECVSQDVEEKVNHQTTFLYFKVQLRCSQVGIFGSGQGWACEVKASWSSHIDLCILTPLTSKTFIFQQIFYVLWTKEQYFAQMIFGLHANQWGFDTTYINCSWLTGCFFMHIQNNSNKNVAIIKSCQ